MSRVAKVLFAMLAMPTGPAAANFVLDVEMVTCEPPGLGGQPSNWTMGRVTVLDTSGDVVYQQVDTPVLLHYCAARFELGFDDAFFDVFLTEDLTLRLERCKKNAQICGFGGDAELVAERPFNTLLDDLYGKVTLDLRALWDALNAEIAARGAADAAETAARQAADQALQDAIDAEEAARIAADQALDAALSAEEFARIAADMTLQGNIDAEAAARLAADTALQASLDAEEAARQAEDAAIRADLAAEQAAREAADAQLQTNLDAEVSARRMADATLRADLEDALADEAAAREAADMAQQAALSAEAMARMAGDAALQANLDIETAARIAADNLLAAQIADEAATRQMADEALQGDLHALEADVITGVAPSSGLSGGGSSGDVALGIAPGGVEFSHWAKNGCAPGQVPKFDGTAWTCASDQVAIADVETLMARLAEVERLLRASSVTTGASHTCALLNTGSVRCWGEGRAGQLGYGNHYKIGDDETPASAGNVNVGGTVSQISAGREHTCALLSTGAVRCWGAGQLGYGNTDHVGDDETPASAGDVSVGGPVTQVAAGGRHTCALLSTGAVRCWGEAFAGQLGYGDTDQVGDDETPASASDVNVGALVIQIEAGDRHTCVLLSTGAVRCWGSGNDGRLGYGNETTIGDNEAPATAGNVNVGGTVVQIAAGDEHTCALLDTGRVRCWGRGQFGRLGYGNTNDIGDDETPASARDVNVAGPVVRVVRIAAGGRHTCALLDTGAVRCWGSAEQLGYGEGVDIGDSETPASAGDVNVGGRVSEISAGRDHTCAVLITGAVRCWGRGREGQLGYGNEDSIGDNDLPSTAGDVPVFP